MSVLLDKIFENRGYYDRNDNGLTYLEEISQMNHAVPKDTDALCCRLDYHKRQGNLVVLLTDFDMDGIMCGVLGYAGLSELGFSVGLFRPSVSEGYGFFASTIDALVKEFPDVKAILTADVGISCSDAITYAMERYGVEVLVTDHHVVSRFPVKASVVVDPQRPDDEGSFSEICGAAVLYEVLLYYARHYTENVNYMVSQIQRLIVFAGFGTVSDIMPLVYENREYVRGALSVCRLLCDKDRPSLVMSLPGCNVYRCAFYGLFILFSVFAEKKISGMTDVNEFWESAIGFRLAPAFNSVKRLGEDINIAYDVFFGSNPDGAVRQLISLNDKRRRLVEKYMKEMLEVPQPWGPYIYITKAPGGICGLMAQRVTQDRGYPAIVLRDNGNGYSGSGRCPGWLPFLSSMPANASWYAAGHENAFGVAAENDAVIDDLAAFLKDRVDELKPDDFGAWVPDAVVSMFGDGDVEPTVDILADYLDEVQRFHPFGRAFEAPSLLLKVNLEQVDFVFMGARQQHLKLMLSDSVEVILWSYSDLLADSLVRVSPASDDERHVRDYLMYRGDDPCLELKGDFQYNVYGGRRSIQFGVNKDNVLSGGGVVHA